METIRKEGNKLIITETKETIKEVTKEQLESEIVSLEKQKLFYENAISQFQEKIDEKQAYLTTHFGK